MTAEADRTVDAFLGGKVEAVQPADAHHRSGLEAVLLSAAIAHDFAGAVVDLGAGSGVAGMAIAARCPAAHVTLVERDAEAIACARDALARPANAGFAVRVAIVATDITAPEAERAAAGLGREVADAVVMNPPFRESHTGTASPDAARRGAHVLEGEGIDPWLRAAASALKPRGKLVVIYRADGLGDLLAALAGRFGGATILPIHPRADLAALRVLVAAEKGSRAPERILPGFALHGVGSAYLDATERILREGAGLADVHPAWASVAG